MSQAKDNISAVREGSGVSFHLRESGDETVVALSGRLDCTTTGDIWSDVVGATTKRPAARLVVDASGLTYLDGAGAGLLVELRRRQRKESREFGITGLAEDLENVLALFPAERFDEPGERRRDLNAIAQIGKLTWEALVDLRFQFAFVGEMTVELGRALLRPNRIRWGDTLRAIEKVGVDSVPVISIIGLLFGLILSFQFAMFLVKFGAELYVADAITVATVRELGPILTAIILAGRSGSAFAAEIGTMKVNEEVDALSTMGLRPVSFLVVPRILATMIVTPMLVLFMTLLAIVGGGVVILAYDYPVVTYLDRVAASTNLGDFVLCMSKGVLFGLLIAATGCMKGLQTGKGSLSVGISATQAVVSSIVIVIVVDGVLVLVSFATGI